MQRFDGVISPLLAPTSCSSPRLSQSCCMALRSRILPLGCNLVQPCHFIPRTFGNYYEHLLSTWNGHQLVRLQSSRRKPLYLVREARLVRRYHFHLLTERAIRSLG